MTSFGHLIWLERPRAPLDRQGGRDAADEGELGDPALRRRPEEDRDEHGAPRRRGPAPAEAAAALRLLVAGGDGALVEARVEQRLGRLAALAVEIRAAEAAAQKRLDDLGRERVRLASFPGLPPGLH